MTYACRLRISLIVLGCFWAPYSAQADLGPLRVIGGSPTVFSHERIRMDSMNVAIRLRKSSYAVDAFFHFFNTGDTTTEWVGFLKRGDLSDFMRYDTWVDGRHTKVVLDKPSWVRRIPYLGSWLFPESPLDLLWLRQQVTIPREIPTIVRLSYEATYQNTGGRFSASYEYGTGGYWKGPIGLAVISVNCRSVGGTKSLELPSIPGWRRLITEDVLRFECANYKPYPGETLTVILPR